MFLTAVKTVQHYWKNDIHSGSFNNAEQFSIVVFFYSTAQK